ncbi:hypothetical protein EYF80_021103 [Liparis tanakae]|uniref:Uncharacterized protein n=1 Tax=Liparis tanakae TaxID=230148 RepID=A0A4Z2HUK7_9TELE|nr:hypothetical protein EYF80_021103 [Liparis tanakae]
MDTHDDSTSQRNSLIPMKRDMTDVGLGTRLKGTGRMPPGSKYENHSFALANFHSTSAWSCTHREETRDLQWPEALVGGQDVCNAGETEHNCDCVEALRNKLRDMMRISIQVKGVVFIRNSCEGWSWMVMLGSSDVPPKRSAAFRTSRPRNIMKEAAWATNFRKGPHMSFPT